MISLRRILIYPGLLALLASVSAFSADDSTATGWKTSLVLDVTATQAAYSDSWTGGEVGNLSWVSNLNGTTERQLTPSFNFRSQLKLSFGQTHSQKIVTDEYGHEKKVWEKPKKSTDLIDWENVGRLTRGWVVDPYVAFRLESQFLDASVEGKKRYLTPMKLTESAGIARMLYERDKDQIISRLGIAVRQTLIKGLEIVNDSTFLNRDSTRTDGGIESVTDVSLALRDNVQYTGKLTLYKALVSSEKDKLGGTPQANYWKAVDVNWENIVSAQITKIVTVNFYLQFLYDKQVELRGRLKETLGVGFVFKMI